MSIQRKKRNWIYAPIIISGVLSLILISLPDITNVFSEFFSLNEQSIRNVSQILALISLFFGGLGSLRFIIDKNVIARISHIEAMLEVKELSSNYQKQRTIDALTTIIKDIKSRKVSEVYNTRMHVYHGNDTLSRKLKTYRESLERGAKNKKFSVFEMVSEVFDTSTGSKNYSIKKPTYSEIQIPDVVILLFKNGTKKMWFAFHDNESNDAEHCFYFENGEIVDRTIKCIMGQFSENHSI